MEKIKKEKLVEKQDKKKMKKRKIEKRLMIVNPVINSLTIVFIIKLKEF